MTKQERLLSILRSRPGHVYSHGEIHDRLWPGWRNDKHLDKASMRGTVKVLVYNLRRQGYQIEAQHGVGYRIVGIERETRSDVRVPASYSRRGRSHHQRVVE